MSLANKMRDVAARAAIEATAREAGRILWILDESEKEIRLELQQKLLLESERHAVHTKLAIFLGLCKQLKMRIASNVRKCERCPRPVIGQRLCQECLRSDRKDNGDDRDQTESAAAV